jgi:uroporphyrin-III C-methyltransferase
MLSTDRSLESQLPEPPYGSVWLIGGGDSDRRHFSPLAVHALSTADAVIHDPRIPREILDMVKPPRYREFASAGRAIERSIKLAEDGWRVVQLVEGDPIERAVECAVRCAERKIPFRIVPNAGELIGGDAPLGLLMVRQPISVGGADPQATLILLVAAPHSDTAAGVAPRQRPLDFSMSGLAG